jgi:hypothetical protein
MRYALWLAAAFVFFVTCATGARGETIYFKVAEPFPFINHGDSYILPLSDPAHIAAARNIIDQGPLNVSERIVVARIEPGADGINRNLGAPFQTWSWHVTEFLGFAEFTIEILDGWPTFVESDVPGWMDNTNGLVGFWSYTVVEEVLVPEPGTQSLVAIGGACLAILVWRLRRRPTQ